MNAVLLLLVAFVMQDIELGNPRGDDPVEQTAAQLADADTSASNAPTDGIAAVAPDTATDDSNKISRGFSIALTGMAIVAVALLLIIGFISSMPRLLDALEPYLPEPTHHHGVQKTHPESQVAEDEAVLAAIGYVLHSRMRKDS